MGVGNTGLADAANGRRPAGLAEGGKPAPPTGNGGATPGVDSVAQQLLENARTKGVALLGDNIRRIFLRRNTLVTVLVLIGICLIPGTVFYYGTHDDWETREVDGRDVSCIDGEPIHELMAQLYYFSFIFIYLLFVTLFISMVFSAMLYTEEQENHTLELLLNQPLSRFEIVFYKYLAGIIGQLVVLMIPVLLLFLSTVGQGGIHGIIEHIGLLAVSLMLVLLAVLAYTAIFTIIAIALPKPVIWGVIYIILWENTIARFPTKIQKGSVSHYLRSAALPTFESLFGNEALSILNLRSDWGRDISTSAPMAMLILLLISAGFLGLSVLALRRKRF